MTETYKRFGSRKAMAEMMKNRNRKKEDYQPPQEKKSEKQDFSRTKRSHGGGVGIQTHGNKLAKALNTQRPDQSLFLNSDGYLTGGIKIRS